MYSQLLRRVYFQLPSDGNALPSTDTPNLLEPQYPRLKEVSVQNGLRTEVAKDVRMTATGAKLLLLEAKIGVEVKQLLTCADSWSYIIKIYMQLYRDSFIWSNSRTI